MFMCVKEYVHDSITAEPPLRYSNISPAAKATRQGGAGLSSRKWKVLRAPAAAHVVRRSCPEAATIWRAATVNRNSQGQPHEGVSTHGTHRRARRSCAHRFKELLPIRTGQRAKEAVH